MNNSKLFSWNLKDLGKGLILAVLTGFTTALYQTLATPHVPTAAEFKIDIMAAVTAGISYLIKNFFSNNEGQIAKPDVPPPAPYNANISQS